MDNTTTVVEITPEEVGVEVKAERFDSLTHGSFRVATLTRPSFSAKAFSSDTMSTHETVNIHSVSKVEVTRANGGGHGLNITVRRSNGTTVNIAVFAATSEPLSVTLG